VSGSILLCFPLKSAVLHLIKITPPQLRQRLVLRRCDQAVGSHRSRNNNSIHQSTLSKAPIVKTTSGFFPDRWPALSLCLPLQITRSMSTCSRCHTLWVLLLLCVYNSAFLIGSVGKTALLQGLEHRADLLKQTSRRRSTSISSHQQCRMSLVDRKMPVGDVSSAKIGSIASMEDFEAAVALSEDKLVIFKAYVPW
jgi:hypothetical protein